MVLKGRPWSDFSGRITYGLADLRGDAFGGVTAGALLLPRPWATASSWVWDPRPGIYGAIAVCLSAAVFGGTRGMIGGTNTFATVTTTVMVAKHTDNLAARFALGLAVGEQWNHFSYLHGGSEIARVEVPGWLADDPELLALSHAMLVRQCELGTGAIR